MGLLADFFVASTDDALTYEDSLADRTVIEQQYSPAAYRNLTGVEVGVLWALLTGEEWDVEKHQLATVQMGDGGETWLLQFPEGLIELLASMDEVALGSAAAVWAKTEELAYWEESAVHALLGDLCRLSRAAKSSGKGLFLWGSL